MSQTNSVPSSSLDVRLMVQKIQEWTTAVKKKIRLVLLICFITSILAYIYAYLQTPKYIAVVSFTVEDEKSKSSLGIGGIASQFGFDVGGGASGSIFSGPSLMELMKTRLIIERAIVAKRNIDNKTTTLLSFFIKHNSLFKSWSKHEKLNSMNFIDYKMGSGERVIDSAVNKVCNYLIGNSIMISQKDKKVNILYLQVTSENELFSKLFAEALIDEASKLYKEIKTGKSTQTVQILERQVDSVRYALNAAMSGIASSNDKTFNLNPALANTLKLPSSQRQVDIQTNTAMLTQLVQNLEATKLMLRNETPLVQIIDEPILPLTMIRTSRSMTALIGAFCAFLICSILVIAVHEIKQIKPRV